MNFYSIRPEEAAEILAVNLEADPPFFDEDSRMPHPEDILKSWEVSSASVRAMIAAPSHGR